MQASRKIRLYEAKRNPGQEWIMLQEQFFLI